jgi:hypothetical protein
MPPRVGSLDPRDWIPGSTEGLVLALIDAIFDHLPELFLRDTDAVLHHL